MLAVSTIVLALLAGVGVVGHLAVSRSVAAAHRGDWTAAAKDARRARFWMPWSPQPWVALGDAQLGAGAIRAAEHSYLKAIAIDRGDWENWYALARATNGQVRLNALRRAAALYPRAGLARRPPRRRANP
jgi:tetratricopeptide (TPR) repeat protein